MRRLSRFLPALGWMGLIFFLSAQSTLPLPKGIWSFDKVLHFGAYFVLGGSLVFALEARHWRLLLLAAALGSLYGVSDELHQSFVPGRSSDVFDWLADTAGSFCAALLAWGYMERRRSSRGVSQGA